MNDARIALAELVVAQDNFSFAQMTMQNVPKARERAERAWTAARAVLAAQPDNDQSGREGNKANGVAEQSTPQAGAPTQGEFAEYLAPDPTAAPAQGPSGDYDLSMPVAGCIVLAAPAQGEPMTATPREPTPAQVTDGINEAFGGEPPLLDKWARYLWASGYRKAMYDAAARAALAAPAQGEPPAPDDLVQRLRDVLRNWTNVTDDEQSVIREAADLIEQQAREIARVKLQLTSEITSALAERDALRLANIDAANLLAECSDMSVDIEKYRNEIAELKSERDAAQRAGVTTANYWMERAELAEDQRERTRDVWATRAERAEAECADLRRRLDEHIDDKERALRLSAKESNHLTAEIKRLRAENAALRNANSSFASNAICHGDRANDLLTCPKAPCDLCLHWQHNRAERAEAECEKLRADADKARQALAFVMDFAERLRTMSDEELEAWRQAALDAARAKVQP